MTNYEVIQAIVEMVDFTTLNEQAYVRIGNEVSRLNSLVVDDDGRPVFLVGNPVTSTVESESE